MFKNFRKEANKNDGNFYKNASIELQGNLNFTYLADQKKIRLLEEGWCEDAPSNRAILKADCMLSSRCPICTMVLPCKHFENVDAIIDNGWFSQDEWEHMP